MRTRNNRRIASVLAVLAIGLLSLSTLADTPTGFGEGLFGQLGLDARATSLGGVGIAHSGGPARGLLNPASLADLTELEVGAMYSRPYGDLFDVGYQYLSILGPLGSESADGIGIGLMWANSVIDEIPLWDHEGFAGTTSSRANVYVASVGVPIDVGFEMDAGASVRYYAASLLEGRGSGFGFDLSATALFETEAGVLEVSLASKDTTNSVVSWKSLSGETKNVIPWTASVGASFSFESFGLVLCSQLDVQLDRIADEYVAHLGAEYSLGGMLMLRAGMEVGAATPFRWSVGAGVRVAGALSFEYAYLPGDVFGDTHLLSGSFSLTSILDSFKTEE